MTPSWITIRAISFQEISKQYLSLVLAVATLLFFLPRALAVLKPHQVSSKAFSAITNFCKFFYASFLKPHSKNDANNGQQSALESFYKAQVNSAFEICRVHPSNIDVVCFFKKQQFISMMVSVCSHDVANQLDVYLMRRLNLCGFPCRPLHRGRNRLS